MALVVFTGGVRSGKSARAQELARVCALDGKSVVVVVFGEESNDAEMAARIERHRADRPLGFDLIEASDSQSWIEAADEHDVLLLDCLGSLVSRIMEEEAGPPALLESVEARVDDVIGRLLERGGDTIVVTNEVGDGVVPAFAAGRLFRDVMGRANRRLVSAADAAYLIVCGRALDLHALPTTVRWPED